MNNIGENKKLDWMYKGPTNLVDREEYLLGRSVDKTLEQLNAEEKEKKLGLVPPKNHVEHECIPPSIRDFNKIVQAEQVDISAKLQEDPLVAIKKREEEARRQFLQNPVQLKKLQEALKAQQMKKKKKTQKKSKTDSDSDLDNKIAKKLKYLKGDPSAVGTKKLKNKSKDSVLDTILMHKFNQLKDKLSQDDLNDILAGNASDSDKETKKTKKQKRKKNSSSESESDSKETKIRDRSNGRGKLKKVRRSSSDDSSEEEERNCEYRYKRKAARRRWEERSNRNEKKLKNLVEDKKNRSQNIDRDNYRYNSIGSGSKVREKKTNNLANEHSKARAKSDGNDSKKETANVEVKKKNTDDSASNLESQILKKLRMLRDSIKSKGSETSDDDNCKKETQKVNNQKKTNDSTNESSSDSDKASSQKPSHHYDSDSDEEVRKPKAFGLVKSDGTKLALNKSTYEPKMSNKAVVRDDSASKSDRRNVKKLSEEEKEKLRREMMKNAEKRDKERSDNLKRYREEDKKEARESANYDKDFLRKELLKSTKDATVETRIKSNLNNIQRSSKHMDSHFSRRK